MQTQRKTLFKAVFLLILAFMIFSCKQEEGSIASVVTVQNIDTETIKSSKTYNSITFMWANPDVENFSHVKIFYRKLTDEAENETEQINGSMAQIKSLSSSTDYIFTFIVYDKNENASSGVSVTEKTADKPESATTTTSEKQSLTLTSGITITIPNYTDKSNLLTYDSSSRTFIAKDNFSYYYWYIDGSLVSSANGFYVLTENVIETLKNGEDILKHSVMVIAADMSGNQYSETLEFTLN